MKFLKRHWITCGLVAFVITMRLLLPSNAGLDDEWFEQLMKDGESAEALSWAKEADGTDELRTIYELGNEESREIIERLYELGAVRVTAIDIDTEPGFYASTDALVVELPDEAAKRKKLFRHESWHAGGFGFFGTPDTGQKYLLFWWD